MPPGFENSVDIWQCFLMLNSENSPDHGTIWTRSGDDPLAG